MYEELVAVTIIYNFPECLIVLSQTLFELERETRLEDMNEWQNPLARHSLMTSNCVSHSSLEGV